ncbi:MAG: FtsQ-type POTRA domain-containing protein, partial [Actinobacteria bacterium]|nr:FtsQ-type POTRA domain-containing protein [Actinomycetota bacterium]
MGIYLSPLFTVESVSVTGESYLTEQEILDLADVPDDATLLRFDKKDVLARLEENPWIEDATIKRKLFSGLELRISERVFAALVQVPIDATS